MKIKYITNVRLPTSRAAGYAIMKMCSEFAKAGVNTELYVPKKENNDNKQDPFDFYKIEKNFQINRIPGLDLLALTEKFGRIFYWIDIIFFLALSKLLIKVGKDDILYTRDYLVALLFSRQNVFLELHDIPRAKSLFKLSIKKAKKIFVLNNNLKNELINLDIAENKIFISRTFPCPTELRSDEVGRVCLKFRLTCSSRIRDKNPLSNISNYCSIYITLF